MKRNAFIWGNLLFFFFVQITPDSGFVPFPFVLFPAPQLALHSNKGNLTQSLISLEWHESGASSLFHFEPASSIEVALKCPFPQQFCKKPDVT
jgi:hypothetical protein